MSAEKRVTVFGTSIVILGSLFSSPGPTACAEQSAESYSDILRAGLGRIVFAIHIRTRLVRDDGNPEPSFMPPDGLDTPEAVPFLIDVVRNGVHWPERDMASLDGLFPYLARGYATLCLGAIGDSRAFEPLTEAMQPDFAKEEFDKITYPNKESSHISQYAVLALGYLGDARAVEPLIECLRDPCSLPYPYIPYHAVSALSRLGDARALVPIVEYIVSQGWKFRSTSHDFFAYLLRIRPEANGLWHEHAYEPPYHSGVFRELGEFDNFDEFYDSFWRYWFSGVGSRFARQEVERFCAVHETGCPEADPEWWWSYDPAFWQPQSGIVAIALIIEKIEQGQDVLIPVLANLTKNRPAEFARLRGGGTLEYALAQYQLSPSATRAECLSWWNENKLAWLVPDTIYLMRVLRVPAEFPTIQAAIDDANDGDLVLVAPGTYTGDGNRDIDFRGKGITVKSEAGPRTCIIDCQGTKDEPHRGFDFHSGEGPNAVLDGFTITGGFVSGILQAGGAVRCQKADTDRPYVSPTIINCIFRGNTAPGGGAIGLDRSQAAIRNCIIWENVAIGLGGAIYCVNNSGPRIINCTVYGNRAESGGGLYLGLGEGPSTALVKNCILWGNTSSAGRESFWQSGCGSTAGCVPLEIEHSCFFPVKLPPPSGPLPSTMITEHDNIYIDPQFVDPNAGDFHLKSLAGHWDLVSSSWVKDDIMSPCIDMGDFSSPVWEEPFLSGARINLGAYGGTAEASKSYSDYLICGSTAPDNADDNDRVDLSPLASRWPQEDAQ